MTQLSPLIAPDTREVIPNGVTEIRSATQSGLIAELRTAVAADLHAESLGELGFDDRRELARELALSRLRRRTQI